MNDVFLELPAAGAVDLAGAPEGHDARIAAALASAGRDVLFVARDDVALSRRAEALRFFAPDVPVLELPAWDCLPYDRVSPQPAIVSRRLDTLAKLAATETPGGRVILTTVSAALQRMPPRAYFATGALRLAAGDRMEPEELVRFLERQGFGRTETVREPGEYAVRGGIVDVFPAGDTAPVRLDFFGDEVEHIRHFDAMTQRSTGDAEALAIGPVSEVPMDEAAISRFRSGYRVTFGVAGSDDPLYEAVSEGRRLAGMDHWLPLFHEHLERLADYLPDATVMLDHQGDDALAARHDLIAEYFDARTSMLENRGDAAPYRPVPIETMFLSDDEWRETLAGRLVLRLTPFDAPEGTGAGGGRLDAGGRLGRDFAELRVDPKANVYDGVARHLAGLAAEGRTVLIAANSEGSRERLRGLLVEHGLSGAVAVGGYEEARALDREHIGLAVLGLDRGFETAELAVVTEGDILGERLARPRRARVKPENVIAEASSLEAGDLVVHVDHGIARFEGLETITAGGAPHDCVKLIYDGGDKLYLPVENIELISRYGSEEAGAQLDRLGGAAWQARKARMKARIRDMADKLIKVAASRELRTSERIEPTAGLMDEFAARFPFAETEDQQRAITDVLDDLARGRPTDRLVCGDVGFGKTEVALRAAFATAMQGKQVAVVVPTTLLSRQHYNNFVERFRGFPVRIAQLSRFTAPKESKGTKEAMAKGEVDIVIGTHALLAKDIKFADLGLLVVDEEQHFGVAHKERLKSLRADVHVLTLTATPIPRTLQMALTGIREMSLIATPPVDRLAVRTFVMPFDPVIVREAILREQYRGGQTFYVCPRVSDLEKVALQLQELVPEAKVAVAHGQLKTRELEDVIGRFYDGAFDVLLATNIIESGLDLPRVNTLIVHRADMFGLAQLYQLRGRVGRSKIRAYAYLTLPADRKLTAGAQKRLEVMQTLDTLGAGFTLASHDLDIRGAGNLLGEEQSGHIREVGIELYQQMLEEAVAEARGLTAEETDTEWSPQITVGMPVLIPEHYVPGLSVRMGLYRRLAWLADAQEIEAFAAELIDRFGPLPQEAENLLAVVGVKIACRRAGIEKIEAGPKGAVIAFRGDRFANPAGLVEWITSHQGTAKLRPDHRIVFSRTWETPKERLAGVRYLAADLARVATGQEQAAQ